MYLAYGLVWEKILSDTLRLMKSRDTRMKPL
jgi:hypothetical protein